jgi:uncharacterized protein YndB with AHSA1/START domain
VKWLWIGLGLLASVVVLVAVVGALLPVAHAAARRIRLSRPPAEVFAAITDVAALPQWRKDLESVEVLPPRDGRRCHREVSGQGTMDLLFEREEPHRLVVARIVTEGSPFGGTWTFRIERDGAGSELTVTENGEVYNVVFRALARFVFGHTATIDGYLRALAAKFGDAAAPENATPDPAPAPRPR